MTRFTSLALLALSFALTAGAAQAQSITTTFTSDNGGGVGGIVYFDVLVDDNELEITEIDFNTDTTNTVDLEVYFKTDTYVGSEGNASAWTLHETVTGLTGAGTDNATNAVLGTPLTLSASTQYAMALVIEGGGHEYTEGTGSNEEYSNGDLLLEMGAAENVPFDGSPFEPRVWNGTLHYTGGESGGGGGGGGGDDGDCSTGTGNSNWLALLGLLSVVAIAARVRGAKS